MQKIKLSELASSAESLKVLSSIKFPVRISYQLSRLNIEVDMELKIFDEKRRDIIKEYGKLNEVTGETSIDPTDKETLAKFYEEFAKLGNFEVELQFANKIKIADLGDIQIESKNLPAFLFE